MNYVKLNSDGEPQEWPVTIARIKTDNPNVSFPANIANVDMSPYGFIPFSYSDPADYDDYQEAVEVTPVLVDGVYVQQWEIREKYTAEEKAAKIAEVQAATQERNATQYKRDRELEYPNIQNQLDMMYWDSVNSTTTWKDSIEAIKNKYPKP